MASIRLGRTSGFSLFDICLVNFMFCNTVLVLIGGLFLSLINYLVEWLWNVYAEAVLNWVGMTFKSFKCLKFGIDLKRYDYDSG